MISFSALSPFDLVCFWLAVFGGTRLFVSLVKSVLNKEYTLDILALIAIFSTIAVGEYFASVVVVAMTLTGDFLENYASKKAKSELSRLISNSPKNVHILSSDRETKDSDINEVKVGDFLRVMPGELIPVDGVLTTSGQFDESSLTGESIPIFREIGDEIQSGAVVQGVAVELKATHAASHSQYQQIVKLVESAQEKKSHTVRLASNISIPFTIVSLLIASLAYFLTNEPLRFAEVLVLATPCPLLIAAPVAFLGGISISAKNGIIIRSGSVLETLNRISVIAFDKTGTLTKGELSVVNVNTFSNISEKEVIQYAASVESQSSHIFSKTILDHAKQNKIDLISVDNVEEISGKGLKANINSKEVLVGNLEFIGAQDNIKESFSNSNSIVGVSVSGKIIGIIEMKDTIRGNSKSTVKILRKNGVKHVVMLTGDNKQVAKAVADELEIKDVRSSLLPIQKLEAVEGLKHSCESQFGMKKVDGDHCAKRAVAMVGDGVNDAPVLAASDVGIALTNQNQTAASEAADVIVLRNDISCVALAMLIAKRTVSISKVSMIGGISLSIVLMIVAAFGHIPAVNGAFLQEAIDLLAILNGVRAAFWKVPNLK